MHLRLKWGILLVTIFVLPFGALASPDFLDDFNSGVDGEDIEDYVSPIGDYWFEQIFGGAGRAFISFGECQVSFLRQGTGPQQCARVLGSETGGLGLGYMHFEPFVQSQKWVEFYYRGALGVGFPRAGVTIFGPTTSHYEDFTTGQSWHHFTYEHSEPITEIVFQSTDHEYIDIDNLLMRGCQDCL